ncbi:hypothetical protein [Streptomyces griseiscabiei]|uniref:HAD-IIIC family phosphatase n=1 Tax=Streptomyces griseiscabiei TaxID=2993540 RepID=A0ABU4KYU2_9ACTN|nr:hypothetical protein [Streptomyces griseiscabiei]MBZ3904827.1 hypothetical protein [Streptomyces griseiscabiei]MDX2908578.1 hypothetical protein [Streptomyces griseiscabiei]
MPPSETLLASVLRQNNRSIARDWAASLNADPGRPAPTSPVRKEFTDRYLPAMLHMVAHLIENPSPELIAVYRDELQRYPLQLGHPLDARNGNIFGFEVAELVAAQRAAISRRFGASAAIDTLDHLHEPLLTAPGIRYNMLLLGDCLMNGVRCFLTDSLREKGISLRGYHQYFSSALSAPFHLAAARDFAGRHPVGMIGFSPFTFDALPVFRQLLAESSQGSHPTTVTVNGVVDLVGHAVEEIRLWSDAPILLHNASGAPEGPERADITSLPPLTSAGQSAINALNAVLKERVRTWPGVLLIDEADIVERVGLRQASEPAAPGISLPDSLHHTSRLSREIARSYEDIVEAAVTLTGLRALAVDFDGTLWSGVMAEGRVTQHRDRQALLRRLARQGIVLIGLSKGTPESIRWRETDITPEDFVTVRRGWEPKPVALAEALQVLDIRPEHVGVIDDDATQRALLASAFPKLTVLDARDRDVWRRLSLAAELTTVTSDGVRRTGRYRTARRRKDFVSSQAGAQATATAMAALRLQLSSGPMQPTDVPRTLELLRRTNQFNTTGMWLSKQALSRMTDPSSEQVVHVASLRDRFGDFGLVAAAVVHRARRSIESFVLSCRAMGYGVENVLLDLIITEYGTPIEARLVRTRLNEPCHGLYAVAGFQECAPGRWRLDHRRPTHFPTFVTVEPVDRHE